MANRNTLIVGSTTYTDDNLYGGVKYRFDLCSGEQIQLGETPSAEIQFTLDAKINIGTMVEYDGVGMFFVSDVKRDTQNNSLYNHVCYDGMSKLDVDAYGWTSTLDRNTPHTISWYLDSLTDYIDMDWTYNSSAVPKNLNQNILVTWPENGMTLRKILSYFAAACGGYAYFGNSGDTVTIAPYTSTGSGTVALTNNDWVNRTISENPTPQIDQLLIMAVEGDVGYRYPATSGSNVMKLMGNPIFYNDDMETATQNVYDAVSSIPEYTAMDITIFNPITIMPPFIMNTTKNGVTTSSYITNMSWDLSGCKCESRGLTNREKEVTYVDAGELKNQARYNKLTRDINETVSEIAALDGRVTTLRQDVDGISSTVASKVSTYSQANEPTNKGIGDLWYYTGTTTSTMTNGKWYRWNGSAWVEMTDSEVNTNASNITTLQQTATSLTSRIQNAEGDINEIEQTMEGVAFKSSLAEGTTVINGGCIQTGTIEAERLALTGAITWNDFSSSAQSRIDSGKGDPNPSYIKSTYIDSTTIEAPVINGGTINAGNLNVIDEYAAKYTIGSTTYVGGYIGADGTTSTYNYVELRNTTGNSRVATGKNGSYESALLESGDTKIIVDNNGEIELDGKIGLTSYSYGPTLPTSGNFTGRLFFKI